LFIRKKKTENGQKLSANKNNPNKTEEDEVFAMEGDSVDFGDLVEFLKDIS